MNISPLGTLTQKGKSLKKVPYLLFLRKFLICSPVSRIFATGEHYDMEMLLDINTDIFPVSEGEKLTVALASSLDPQVILWVVLVFLPIQVPDGGYYDSRFESNRLVNKYDYIMYGKVYRYEEEKANSRL